VGACETKEGQQQGEEHVLSPLLPQLHGASRRGTAHFGVSLQWMSGLLR